MFTEKEMNKAVSWLFGLFVPEDYETYDEEEMDNSWGLCLPEICNALREKAQTAYQYQIDSSFEKGFCYRGKELFGQRASMMYSDVEVAAFDMVDTTYETELWLLEDMSFAVVHCVTVKVESDEMSHTTEYRAVVRKVESRDDLFFTPEALIEVLEEMCVPQWESEATIYEL